MPSAIGGCQDRIILVLSVAENSSRPVATGPETSVTVMEQMHSSGFINSICECGVAAGQLFLRRRVEMLSSLLRRFITYFQVIIINLSAQGVGWLEDINLVDVLQGCIGWPARQGNEDLPHYDM